MVYTSAIRPSKKMEENKKLSFFTKVCFGAGEIPGTTSKTVMGLLLMYFLTDVVGIVPAMAGAIFMIGRAWDGFTDPFMGMVTDRTRTRWGRRRPFFLLAAFPLGLAFFFLWYPYPLESQLAKACAYTIIYICYMTAITIYFVPYLGLMAELSDDYVERVSINNYRIFYSLVFGLLAAVIPKMVVDSFDDKRTGFMVAGAGVAVLISIVPFIVFGTTRERFQNRTEPRENLQIFRELSSVFKNKSFLSLLLIYLGSFAAINVIEGFVVYYMKYWIGREKEMPLLFVSVVISSALSLPLWIVLAKKIGKKNTAISGLLFWGVTQFGWLLLGPSTATSLVCLTGAVIGIGFGSAHSLPWAIFPDVMDQDELETGKRREGIFSGVMTFFMKLANSLAMFMVGLVLQAVGYVPNVPQKGLALQTMRYLMWGGPLVFILVALIAAFLFPITVERFQQIREELDSRRTE
jgi:sugar (glycoside-pentoside-hexuronide) transporter